MLINAMRPQEVRAAILENNRLEQLEIEVRHAGLLKGNIYRGKVANIHAGLNACFVEFGVDKQGFLPFGEIPEACWHKSWKGKGKTKKPAINDVMQKGREIVVQVVKDAIGDKGAALTSRISLAGRYIVLMPLDDCRGVSRKIKNESQRKKIKELAGSLKIPEEYGFIVRTAGLDRTKTDLNNDAARLVRTWKGVLKDSEKGKGTQLLHEDDDLVVRMLRDYYNSDIAQIIVDRQEAWEKASDYFKTVMPRSKRVLTQYVDKIPLFTRYQVEQQIEALFSRRVDLPSGGYILVDPTEALVAVDVNSGRSTKHKSQADTAHHTNIEAAREVARQLRLRDLGGLIVIDFIDMANNKHRRQVEKTLKDGLRNDKARSYVSRISENGLLELNRQRLKAALAVQTHRDCPTCEGRGVLPSVEFIALKILRMIEARAANGTFAKVTVQLHPELADHIQNHLRRDLIHLEDYFGIVVALEGRPGRGRGEERIQWGTLADLSDTERERVTARREELKAEAEADRNEARDGSKGNAELPAEETAQEPVDEHEDEAAEESGTAIDDQEPDAEADTVSDVALDDEDSQQDSTTTDEGSDDEDVTASTASNDDEQPRRSRNRRRSRGRRGGRGRSREGNSESTGGSNQSESTGGSNQTSTQSSGGEPHRAHGAPSGNNDDEQPLSRSQKRRRRRKRKLERDGTEPGHEGENRTQSGESSHRNEAAASSTGRQDSPESTVTSTPTEARSSQSSSSSDAPPPADNGVEAPSNGEETEDSMFGRIARFAGFGRKDPNAGSDAAPLEADSAATAPSQEAHAPSSGGSTDSSSQPNQEANAPVEASGAPTSDPHRDDSGSDGEPATQNPGGTRRRRRRRRGGRGRGSTANHAGSATDGAGSASSSNAAQSTGRTEGQPHRSSADRDQGADKAAPGDVLVPPPPGGLFG